MPVPVLTFFNNKGGVGKTSLVYHLAWMLSKSGHQVLACDLDPQANLTSMFLSDDQLEFVYGEDEAPSSSSKSVFDCVKPLMKLGDLKNPEIQVISPELGLIPGDLALAGFEDTLSAEWPKALDSGPLDRPFRILSAFSTIMQAGAQEFGASIIIADVGPNLGAINRSGLIATDFVVVPVGADLFSLRGLRNLGPTLRRWRGEWQKRLENWEDPEFALPSGGMEPIGYVVQQHSVRLDRPVRAYDKWVNRVPRQYAESLLGEDSQDFPRSPEHDPHALATIKHYRSLVPMAQEARKPVFNLNSADGAIGSHAAAARAAFEDFRLLSDRIRKQMGESRPELAQPLTL